MKRRTKPLLSTMNFLNDAVAMAVADDECQLLRGQQFPRMMPLSTKVTT
jgi:hypothetical protein